MEEMTGFPSFYSHHYEVCNKSNDDDNNNDHDDDDDEIIEGDDTPLIENRRLFSTQLEE